MTKPSTSNDMELADLLRQGDAAAFKMIYDTYWVKLFFVASKRLGNTHEAEELVQDIFLNLWNRRASFYLKGSFENYLAVAVKFEVYKRRALRERKNVLTEGLLERAAEVENQDWNLHDLHFLQEEISKTIDSLPNKCKLVFTMSRQSEMTNKQVAEHFGITEKAVEKHITNAFKVLRSRFGRYFIFIIVIKELF